MTRARSALSRQLDLTFAGERALRIKRFDNSQIPTACRPQFAEASNGKTYLAKTNGPGGPHVVAQEFLCGQLAQIIGVPVPPFRLLNHKGTMYFGSERVKVVRDRFDPMAVGEVVNPGALYLIAAFDVWVHNGDRHESNLVIAESGRQRYLQAIDHSHCPLHGAHATVANLFNSFTTPATSLVRPYLRSLMTDRNLLMQAVDRVEAVGDDEIVQCVEACHELAWTDEERAIIAQFLQLRRAGLRTSFNAGTARGTVRFPALAGGAL